MARLKEMINHRKDATTDVLCIGIKMGKERQRQRNEKVRQAIVDTAVQIALEHGFESLSIRKITNRLGYSAGSVYYYFKDKDEIVEAIHKEADTYIINMVKDNFDVQKGIEYNLRSVFFKIMDFALLEPDKYNLIVFDKYLKRRESIDLWVGMLEQSIKASISAGELRELDCRLTAYNIWSSFWGLIVIINTNNSICRTDAEKLFNNHLEIIMNGIKK